MYLLGDKEIDPGSVMAAASGQGATDVILANFSQNVSSHGVLTLYRALPFSGGRALVFADASFNSYQEEFRKQLTRDILPLLGLDESAIREIRIARWGHPLPLAKKGFFSSGFVDIVSRPFMNRVFFAEQDNWVLPAFETAVTEAHYCAELLQRNMKSNSVYSMR
jgi:hypothetical protein